MLRASSIAPLHFFGKDDRNVVQHELFSHVIPLVPVSVSHDKEGIINDIIIFVRSRQNEMHHDVLVMLCHWHECQHHMTMMATLMESSYFLGHDNQNEVHDHVKSLVPESALFDSDVCYVNVYI